MFNPTKINELLQQRKISKSEFLSLIFGKGHHSFTRLNADIRVSTLEKIADYFNLPLEYFFDNRPTHDGVTINGNRNSFGSVNVNSILESNEHYKAMLAEKDERIKLLEGMIELLKATNHSTLGQISDTNL